MKDNEKTAREELLTLLREKVQDFGEFLKPNPQDHLGVQIIKSILKIPVAIFVTLLSPILLLILAIIFIVMI